MREIKFRGKRIDNGEWVYGYYFIEERDIEDGIIWRDIPQIQQRYGDHYQYFDVIPETIGQYTGLIDKNGREIYEGDIVRIDDLGIGIVDYEEGRFAMRRREERFCWPVYCRIDHSPFVPEVIGNIHENPELLEVRG